MRILFCSQTLANRQLGGSKVVMELAESMKDIGWSCTIKSGGEIHEIYQRQGSSHLTESLCRYLACHASEYDVVDYDHSFLPFPRTMFAPRPLFVARSVLLAHQCRAAKIPKPSGASSRLRAVVNFLRHRNYRSLHNPFHNHPDITIQHADLVNVPTSSDRNILISSGVSRDKIKVIPFGIDASRRKLFDSISDVLPEIPKVAFVGTFDYRKGCLDFPKIIAGILKMAPTVKFKLLGTSGMYKTEDQVRRCFSRSLQHALEIVPYYNTEELPHYLSDCSLGFFPSYLEGLPFGVIEMLAAGLPVFSYDAPGSRDILEKHYLVPAGDTQSMADKITEALANGKKLERERSRARLRSQPYSWDLIAAETDVTYRACISRRINAQR